jgi:carbamoyl-phosphate synthase large subunit
VRKHGQGRGPDGEPTIVDRIIAGEVDMVLNTPSGPAARHDGYEIRAATTSVDRPIVTTIQQFSAAVQAIEAARNEPVRVTSLQDHGIRLRALRVEQDAESVAAENAVAERAAAAGAAGGAVAGSVAGGGK